MSARWSTSLPKACSGAMKPGVPRIAPAAVSSVAPAWPLVRASPRSVTLAPEVPPECVSLGRGSARRMFPGLMSLWMMPAAQAWASPDATSRTTPSALPSSMGPFARTQSAQFVPETSSMARKTRPFDSP